MPQQRPHHTGKFGMDRPAQNILQLESSDRGGLGMHQLHLVKQSIANSYTALQL